MTKTTFKKGMTIFTACIKDFPLDKDKAAVWFRLLKDMPDELFLEAVHRVCQTEKNIYPGTNIVAMIRESTGGMSIDASAALAWEKAYGALISHGNNSVVFDDPIIHAVIYNLGGWIKFCEMMSSDMKWWRKDFERLYTSLISVPNLNPPKRLMGTTEQTNRLDGYNEYEDNKLPVIIGNKQKALEWTGLKLPETQKKLEGEDGVVGRLPETTG